MSARPANILQPVQNAGEEREPEQPQEVTHLKIYGHSPLAYWWPVWLVGYVMAAITYFRGQQYQIGQDLELFYPSSNLGVLFMLTLVLVILITNVSVRGTASGLVILGTALVAVIIAYFGKWDVILAWFGALKIHLNFGSYFWFSTVMLIIWTISVFVIDRMSYWHFKPGQVTHDSAYGSRSQSYDTNGMVLVKHREDLFRHWLLGLGSGDLLIRTTGASSDRIEVQNVFFIGSKIEIMQRLISKDPSA